jgi:hypothetical protein
MSDPSSIVYIVAGEGASTWVADLRGTFSAGTTIAFETTVDGINWESAAGVQWGSTSPALVNNISGPGPWTYTGGIAAFSQFRVRATSINPGDNVSVTLRISVGSSPSFSTGGGGGGGTVNQGSPNTLANAWTVKITDGVNGPVSVLPGSTAASVGNSSLVVALSPNSPLPSGTNTIGAITGPGGGPVAVTGSFTATLEPYLLNSQEDPTTGAQTNNLTSSGGPTPAGPQTPLATSCIYSSLGGEYNLNVTIANENLLGVFAYPVPAGRTLYITNVILPPPVVTYQLSGGPFGQLWELFVASSTNPSTATGTRFPLTTFGGTAGLQAGNNLQGAGVLQLSLQTPIVAVAGQWVLICYKVVGMGGSSGVFRGTCHINGYFI